MSFKKDFLWGVASAAYQIEGAAFEDGKGLSIWDVYSHISGKIKEEHNGDVACDHYHRYKEDVALMKELGTKVYRFSVSWARVLPNGVGEVNQKGIDFYNNLIDELLAAGITPCLVLFHWDYPYELYKKGGWLNADSSEWFKYYTEVCAKAFGDRVKMWITFNEPQCFLGEGHLNGGTAPGIKMTVGDVVRMGHNVMLSHGKAVMAIRELVEDSIVGYAPSCDVCAPDTDDPRDVEAARRRYFSFDEEWWMWNVSLWSDPVMLGRYPEEDPIFQRKLKPHLPEGYQEDMKIICQPLDFYGQNIYTASHWSADENGEAKWTRLPTGTAKSTNNWPLTPEALYWGPKFLYERYKTPIIITENGMACHDWISVDGKVHDPNRIDYITRYLRALKKCSEDGADIAGYWYWALLDNFEWGDGYTQHFGLVYMNYQTLERVKKDSFDFYKEVMATNGENI